MNLPSKCGYLFGPWSLGPCLYVTVSLASTQLKKSPFSVELNHKSAHGLISSDSCKIFSDCLYWFSRWAPGTGPPRYWHWSDGAPHPLSFTKLCPCSPSGRKERRSSTGWLFKTPSYDFTAPFSILLSWKIPYFSPLELESWFPLVFLLLDGGHL